MAKMVKVQNKMGYLRSYIVLAFCLSMTSSAFSDLQGNADGSHRDNPSDVKEIENLAPPTDSHPKGKCLFVFSNEAICRELCNKGEGGNACLCDWPPLQKTMLFSLKSAHKDAPLSNVVFPTPENDDACKLLCKNGEQGHFCLC